MKRPTTCLKLIYRLSKIATVVMLCAAVACSISTVSANNELLNPNYAFSTNYYDSFGEPDLYASIKGDPEFHRGETARIQIILVNKGILSGFKYSTSVGTDKLLHAVSLKELEYESRRTTALGIEAQLKTDSQFIDIDPDTSVQTLESLAPGELPEDPLIFTITLSNAAPAGVYYLQLPVSYEYQNQVRMTTNDVMRVGITNLDHTVQYVSANKTLIFPIHIKESPDFAVADVSGYLLAGVSRTVDVTYENTGEKAAVDAIARIVAMQPITITHPVIRLGTLEPGERKTVTYEISADPDAPVKTYGLDSEIKYLNEDDEMEISANLKVSVPLEASKKKPGAFMLAMAGIIVLVIYLIVNTLRDQTKLE